MEGQLQQVKIQEKYDKCNLRFMLISEKVTDFHFG